jgi:hypothetical protein
MRRLAGRALRALLARRGCIEAPLGSDWADALDAIRETRRRVPLLMCDAAALQLLICARATRHLGGAIAEAGVFRGGSARLLCTAKGGMPLHLLDVFETLQTDGDGAAPHDESIAVRAHFGRTHGRMSAVRKLLAAYPEVHFHPGPVGETLCELADLRFALVHLDLDLAGPMLAALEFFHPRLLPGGMLIGDDYADPDVRATFDDYFAGRGDMRMALPWGQVLVVRQRSGREDGQKDLSLSPPSSPPP